MRRLPFSFLALLLLMAGLTVQPAAHAQRRMRKYKPPPPMAQVEVTVLKNSDGKPLQNAAVIFHATSEGDKNEGNMELKSNKEGKATLSIVPIGSKVLVQVIAPGYRTFGAEYDIPSDKKAITVRMVPPQEQYSIYAKNSSKSDVQTNTPQTQMGHAAPADSPLLAPPPKHKNKD